MHNINLKTWKSVSGWSNLAKWTDCREKALFLLCPAASCFDGKRQRHRRRNSVECRAFVKSHHSLGHLRPASSFVHDLAVLVHHPNELVKLSK